MRWHKLAGAGIAVTAAAAAGSLIAGGVGSAATTASRSSAITMARSAPPPRPSRAAIKASVASAATVNAYLRVDGVAGEVTRVGYAGTIEVASFSWGLSNPAGGTGKPFVSTLNVMAGYDRAEPRMETDAETGATIKQVTLTELASDGSKIRTVVLTNAHLDSLQISGSVGSGSPFVSLSVSYVQRRITYYYKDSNGISHSTTSCWNVAANATC